VSAIAARIKAYKKYLKRVWLKSKFNKRGFKIQGIKI
jgi:hypothetical protein